VDAGIQLVKLRMLLVEMDEAAHKARMLLIKIGEQPIGIMERGEGLMWTVGIAFDHPPHVDDIAQSLENQRRLVAEIVIDKADVDIGLAGNVGKPQIAVAAAFKCAQS